MRYVPLDWIDAGRCKEIRQPCANMRIQSAAAPPSTPRSTDPGASGSHLRHTAAGASAAGRAGTAGSVGAAGTAARSAGYRSGRPCLIAPPQLGGSRSPLASSAARSTTTASSAARYCRSISARTAARSAGGRVLAHTRAFAHPPRVRIVVAWIGTDNPGATVRRGSGSIRQAIQRPCAGTYTGLRPSPRVLFWNAVDLERKLETFRDHYNDHRVHRAIAGLTPAQSAGALCPAPAALDHYGWQQHCQGLFELQIAA